jgi:membrane protein DedA with SNARE-associated domain
MDSALRGLASSPALLGPLGAFVVALADSSFLSLFEVTDALAVRAGATDPGSAWATVLCLVLGSLAGCSILYGIGRGGGEALLAKRFGEARAAKAKAAYLRWDVLSLALPAVLPPPAPFKVFVLAAGVFGCRYRRFALSIVGARALRYCLWVVLGMAYGKEALDFVSRFTGALSAHPYLALAIALVAGVGTLLVAGRGRAA